MAVAAVPEGLPLVATLAQQAAARRLTAAGVLVRAPRSIEALGRVDVVCFDKTGTLSENKLRVGPRSNASTAGTKARFWKLRRAVPWEVATIACFIRRMPPSSMQPSKLWTTLRFSVTSRRTTSFRSGRGRPYSAALLGRRIALKGSPEFVTEAGRDPTAVSAKHVQSMAGRGPAGGCRRPARVVGTRRATRRRRLAISRTVLLRGVGSGRPFSDSRTRSDPKQRNLFENFEATDGKCAC